jgi:hypothetical protein
VQALSELIENAQRFADSTERNLSYATNTARAKAASRRMREDKRKVERLEAKFEALQVELRDLGIEVDAKEPTVDELPEIKAARAEVKAWRARAGDLGIDIAAVTPDVDEPPEAQGQESEEVDVEKPFADIFLDTFTRHHELAKALFRLWLTSARVWDLPRIREYSRKVLGVDEISVDEV